MQLLVFDIDGTLTQTNRVDDACFIRTLTEFLGTADFDTDWRNYPHVSDSGILDSLSRQFLGRPPSVDETAACEAAFLQRLKAQPAAGFQMIPGAAQMIEHLQQTGQFKLAIATGCWLTSAEHKLRTAGIDFSAIPMATATDTHARVDILKTAMRKATAPTPDEIIYFGDAEWDVRATEELGWRMIGIGDRIERLRALGTRDCFSSFQARDKLIAAIERT